MPKVNIYNSKYRTLSGTSRSEVYKKARREYNDVAHATKRQPYIRSKYFNGSKIFLDVILAPPDRQASERADKTAPLLQGGA